MSIKMGYECLADRSGVTVSSVQTAATNVAANAFDRLEFDFWQIDANNTAPAVQLQHASAQASDYIAFFGHDLVAATDEYRVRYSANGTTWFDALAWTSVLSGVNFKTFTQQSDKYWRIEFRRDSGATAFAPKIAIISIGTVYDVSDYAQIGFRPPLANGFKATASVSLGGQFIGRSIREQAQALDLSLKHQTPASIRSSWLPFLNHAKSKPFFMSWDEVNYPGEAAFCWTEKEGDAPLPNCSSATYMDAMLKFRAKI